MPLVEVSQEVYEELKKRAVPLEDTVDSVLRRTLGIVKVPLVREIPKATKEPNTQGEQRRFDRSLKEADYVCPILSALERLGGQGRVQEVMDIVETMVSGKLSEDDRRLVGRAQVASWRNTAQWARSKMITGGLGIPAGLLKATSPHGVWEMTQAGKDYLKLQRSS